MKALAILLFGAFSYLIFSLSFLYFILFVENIFISGGLDGVTSINLYAALGLNLGLVLLFGLQHSVMARKGFKIWLHKFMPVAMERSNYVLISSLCLIALVYFWEPISPTIWDVGEGTFKTILIAISLLGFFISVLSTYFINHFDLFGLRQVWMNYKGMEYKPLPFQTPFLYRYLRHPLYFGFLLAFWSAPLMTLGHFIFALSLTVYIFIGIHYEEKDLKSTFGEDYGEYKKEVPMILPNVGLKRDGSGLG